MEIVIDIPEKEYHNIQIMVKDGIGMLLYDLIANGTPLLKGHGRLIDADALIHWHRFESKSDNDIANAPTIIETDKGSEG
jgi:hypothetical protein